MTHAVAAFGALLLGAQLGVVAGDCRGWCERRNDSHQCGWRYCYECAWCQNAPPDCRPWCQTDPAPVETRCQWHPCSSCAACSPGTPTTSPAPTTTATRTFTGRVRLEGHQLIVDGHPLHLKGVNWQPVPRGLPLADEAGLNIDWAGGLSRDVAKMRLAGVNAVRTYQPLTDVAVLDTLYENGIYVFNGIYNNYVYDDIDGLAEKVNSVKDHPSIVMWVVGNEFNFNYLYTRNTPHRLSQRAAVRRLVEVCQRIRAADTAHPIAAVFLGPYDQGHYTLARMSGVIAQFGGAIDAWGFNVYSWDRIPDAVFQGFVREHPGVPFFVGEYGTDAYNADIGQVDEASQAHAVAKLTADIAAESSAAGGSCMGGFIMEWNDEWWKRGNPSEHGLGTSPNGVYPDNLAHEEWFGLVDVDGVPRMALEALGHVSVPAHPGPTTSASAAPPTSSTPTTSSMSTSSATPTTSAAPPITSAMPTTSAAPTTLSPSSSSSASSTTSAMPTTSATPTTLSRSSSSASPTTSAVPTTSAAPTTSAVPTTSAAPTTSATPTTLSPSSAAPTAPTTSGAPTTLSHSPSTPAAPTTSAAPTTPSQPPLPAASCAAHPHCAHLAGDCCPTPVGVHLACCEPGRRLRGGGAGAGYYGGGAAFV